MPDKFDPYREALIMETETVWPQEYDDLEWSEKTRIAKALHAEPASCSQMAYVRVHTGFCRQITVSSDDIERVG